MIINLREEIIDFINSVEDERFTKLTDEEVESIADETWESVANDKELLNVLTSAIMFYVNKCLDEKENK